MYRGQDIGDAETLVHKCLTAIQKGHPDEIRPLLPHISIVRSPQLKGPLLKLLNKGDARQKELAAIALGSLGDKEAITPLCRVYESLKDRRGKGSEALRVALILALGEIGHEDAVQALAKLYRSDDSVFQAQRRQLVLSSLGLLAQQGSVKAEEQLSRLLTDRDEVTQVDALCELAVAYWHRPNQIPDSLLLQMYRLAREGRGQIRQAALSSLRSLADLGCRQAEEFFAVDAGRKGKRQPEREP